MLKITHLFTLINHKQHLIRGFLEKSMVSRKMFVAKIKEAKQYCFEMRTREKKKKYLIHTFNVFFLLIINYF